MPNSKEDRVLIKKTAITLRNLRKRIDLSQEQLAKKSGIDRTYISGVERGVRNITLDSLETIIQALEITPETFLTELRDSLDRSET